MKYTVITKPIPEIADIQNGAHRLQEDGGLKHEENN